MVDEKEPAGPKVEGLGLRPAFANRLNVAGGPDVVRLTFGETLPGGSSAHTVIVVTRKDARTFAELILRIVDQPLPENG